MKFKQSLLGLTLFSSLSCVSFSAFAQSTPAATQQLQLSAFVAGTGTFTDLSGGRNLGITAGADITVLHFHLFRPAFEIRGTYPVYGGTISSQKNFLLGPKVEYPMGRFHPYADFLIGRGGIDYLRGGYVFGTIKYISSNTVVYSPGIGFDYNLTHNLAVKADFQYQHWDTPATPSGTINPRAFTLGGVYVFDFNSRHRHEQ
jgi:opacity protein-like surface antigen